MLPRIGQRPPIAGGIKSWLQSANFIPETLSPNAVAAIRVEDFGGLVPYISYDYERFALSSIESLASASIRTKLADLSWPLLKTYYAGFFAAHSIMRSRGAGVVNLSSNQTKKSGYLLSCMAQTSVVSKAEITSTKF